MDRKKVFKKEINKYNYNKMCDNNNMIAIKDFQNQSDFKAKIDIQNL
jgi:hypothetical protein